ncbi:MAG: hypothetical protein ACR2OC_06580 [Solirubrobacterales bacterium]
MDPDVADQQRELREEIAGLRNDHGERFDRVDRDIDRLRGEVGGLRGEISDVRGEVGGLRGEMVRGFERVDGRIDALQVTLVRIGGGVIVGLVGVIAAVLARGV